MNLRMIGELIGNVRGGIFVIVLEGKVPFESIVSKHATIYSMSSNNILADNSSLKVSFPTITSP